jgi:hypothetical protein
MVPSDNPALWTFASSCIQFVLLHLMMGQVYSFSGKKEDVSFLITKAKSKCRALERYFQRTPDPPAAEGTWINVAEFFDWHGCPEDVDPGAYQELSASVYDALVYYITDAKKGCACSLALGGHSESLSKPGRSL